MTDSADMTGHLPPLSACGCGWKGGRTRTRVLGRVRCPPPTGWQSIDNELAHDWQACHHRQPRRDRVAGHVNRPCLQGGNAAGRVIFTSAKLDTGCRGGVEVWGSESRAHRRGCPSENLRPCLKYEAGNQATAGAMAPGLCETAQPSRADTAEDLKFAQSPFTGRPPPGR